MDFLRRHRRIVAAILGWAVLSTQFALAAYNCAPMPAAQADMPPCHAVNLANAHALDPEQPALCIKHCQYGNDQLERGAAAPLVLALPPAASMLWSVWGDASAGVATPLVGDPVRPTPPLTLLHCCLRN